MSIASYRSWTRPEAAAVLLERRPRHGRTGQATWTQHLVTLVERHSRCLLVLPISTASTASVTAALCRAFASMPAFMAKSLTWDPRHRDDQTCRVQLYEWGASAPGSKPSCCTTIDGGQGRTRGAALSAAAHGSLTRSRWMSTPLPTRPHLALGSGTGPRFPPPRRAAHTTDLTPGHHICERRSQTTRDPSPGKRARPATRPDS